MISLDTVVFGLAVHVAAFQMSSGLIWTIRSLFCMYVQSVTVCCDISAGLIDQLIHNLQVMWVYFLTCAF
jgi:hypothetical protein